MRKNLTELVFILDHSGSMQGLEGDTTLEIYTLHITNPIWSEAAAKIDQEIGKRLHRNHLWS